VSKRAQWEYSQALVAHACNPSYSGGRGQENCGLKPQDPILKKPITKVGLVECLKVLALSSKPRTTKKTSKQMSEI
jgi:hypothetical protein